MTWEIWAVVIGFATLLATVAGFGLALVVQGRSTRKSNEAASQALRDDFNRRFDGVRAQMNQLDAKNDAAVKALKEDERTAHAEIGANICRVDESVKAAEKRVTDNFNARFDDLRDYVKLALKTADKD